MRCLFLLVLLTSAGCGDNDPSVVGTATPSTPNQFGYRDEVFRAAAAGRDIAPLQAGSAAALANPMIATFESFTDFDLELVCPNDPTLRLRLQPNSLFDGVLTRPQGAEPFVDCGGTAGRYDAGVDVFEDLNGNQRFDGDATSPEGLEPFDDANHNNNFDAIWMGGFDSARATLGIDVDNPPAVRAMILSRGQEYVVLVTLDTIGNASTHLLGLRQRIANELGLDGSRPDSPDVERIIIASTHDHEAADTLGVAGPTAAATDGARRIFESGLIENIGAFGGVPVRTGINFAYRDWLDEQAVAAVKDAAGRLRPAEMRVASAPAVTQDDSELLTVHPVDQDDALRVPRRDHLLLTDIRWPFVRDPEILSLQLRDRESGATIAALVNWANHVEVLGSRNNLLSADYAGYVRGHLEESLGGVGIFMVSAVGGLQTPLQDAFVPLIDATGRVHNNDGTSVPIAELYAPVLDRTTSPSQLANRLLATARRATNDSPEKAASLGRMVAVMAKSALDRSLYRPPPKLTVATVSLAAPLENPILYLAAVLGVVEGRETLVHGEASPLLSSDRPAQCGNIGCLNDSLALIDLGDALLVTAPGELLPEYVIGRPRPGIDQDEGMHFTKRAVDGSIAYDFGVQSFAPIRGLRTLHATPLFIIGLAQTQLGYLIPQSDFVNVFEGFLPPVESLDSLGLFANLDIARLAGLSANPGFVRGETLSVREIITRGWDKFPAAEYPAVAKGAVSLVDIPDVNIATDHPNVIGNNNSLGPRVGHVAYNAMCDLIDDGQVNHSCRAPLPVAHDPNQ